MGDITIHAVEVNAVGHQSYLGKYLENLGNLRILDNDGYQGHLGHLGQQGNWGNLGFLENSCHL